MILSRDIVNKIVSNNRTNERLLNWTDDVKVQAIVERLCKNILHSALQGDTNINLMCYLNDITKEQSEKIVGFMSDILGYDIQVNNTCGYYEFKIDFRRRF